MPPAMLMEELHAEMCVGSQVIQDPLLSMHMTFLMLISSFSINLGCSSRDLAFHFNPRFNESVIVCNSKCADTWQTEHRDRHIPFYRGCIVKVRALCQHGLVGYVCGEGKPSVSRFPYHNLPSPTQYLLLPHNCPSSSGFLVLIAISTPPSKLQCCFGEYYVSPVCLTLCKCFLAPPICPAGESTWDMYERKKSLQEAGSCCCLPYFSPSLLCKHRL